MFAISEQQTLQIYRHDIEAHVDRSQFFRFEKGEGKVVIDGIEHKVKDGDAVIVPASALNLQWSALDIF